MFKSYLLKILAGCQNLLLALGSILAGFFAPIQGLIFLSFILCLLDFLTKIYLVYKKEGFKAVQSKKMESTGFKMLFYACLLSALQLVHILFFVDYGGAIFNVIFTPDTVETIMKLNIASVGAFLIVMRELKSIDENWESFSGWSFIETVNSKFSWIFKLRTENENNTSKD